MMLATTASGVEGSDSTNGMVTFSVSAFPTPTTDLTATWTISFAEGNTAASADDFPSTTGTVTIATGSDTGTFNVMTNGDDIPEFDESFTVTLSNPGAGTQLSDAITATGTITNDDGTGLSIKPASVLEGDDGDTVTMDFEVRTIPPSDAEITYTWAITTETSAGDEAVVTNDFTKATDTETITVGAASDTISVPIVSDDVPEVHETFTLTLSSPTGATLLVTSVQGTILNDDGIVFSIEDGTLAEGAMGAADNEMMFTITASDDIPAGQTITLTWVTSIEDGDSAEVDDFTAVMTGTVEFNDSTTNRMEDIEVVIIGDDTPEFDDTFTVTLTGVTLGGQISRTEDSATGTIENDDGTGLRIADVSMGEGDSGETNMTFTVEAIPPNSDEITFDWTTKDDTGDNLATAGTDYTMSAGDDVTIGAGIASVDITVPISG